LGALRLEEFGEGVKPHEHTLSGPKADRLNLLRATRTNTSPIFGLHNDNDGWVSSLLANATTDEPHIRRHDSDGIHASPVAHHRRRNRKLPSKPRKQMKRSTSPTDIIATKPR
jgi:uncharacterized protein (DUF1015 family)